VPTRLKSAAAYEPLPTTAGRLVAVIRGPGSARTVERAGSWTEETMVAAASALDGELWAQVFEMLRGQADWTISVVAGAEDDVSTTALRPLLRRKGSVVQRSDGAPARARAPTPARG
jgi:hypothetical protein